MRTKLLIVGVLSLVSVDVAAAYGPVYYEECLNRDMSEDFDSFDVPRWAEDAIAIVMSGNIGKHPVDMIQVQPDEIALGWAHFTAQRDPFRLNAAPPEDHTDHEWWWQMLALLYSDEGPRLQYEAWRRTIDRVIDLAPQHCIEDRPCVTLLAAMSNSGTNRARRIAEECNHRIWCMSEEYADGSAHRQRRVDSWQAISL